MSGDEVARLREAAQSLVDALPYEPGSMLGGKIALLVYALSGVPEGAASDSALPSWQSIAAILHEIATIDGCGYEGHEEAHEDEAKVMLNIIRHASGQPVPSPEPLDVERLARLDAALRDIEAIAVRGERDHSYSQPAGGFFRDIVTVAREARLADPQPVPEDEP